MNSVKKYNDNVPYIVFIGFALISIAIGFISTPSVSAILEGLRNIVTHHHMIDSELIIISGNFGSAFVNAGIIVLFILIVYRITNTKITGMEIAAIGQSFGYSFYGLSIFNIWPLVIGCLIEGIVHKKELGKISYIAWFSTALAPFVSNLSFNNPVLPIGAASIAMGIIAGLIAGFLVGALVSHLKELHRGNILFSVGFTTGTIGFFLYSILKASGFAYSPYTEGVYIEGMNTKLFAIFMIFNAYMFLVGLILEKELSGYTNNLLTQKTVGGDYVTEYGLGQALINFGVMGTAGLLYAFATIKGQIKGPMIGGIFTIAGFGAGGMTLLSCAPIWGGIYAGSFLTGGLSALTTNASFLSAAIEKVSSRAMLVAAMHGCGLSPLAKKYGWTTCFIAAMIHSVIVPNTGKLHGWMCSYNNGFAEGLNVVLFLPILLFFRSEKFIRVTRQQTDTIYQ